ncbi:MAG: hypothetical protein V8S72_05755 [Oscillospiraceae bacterium]
MAQNVIPKRSEVPEEFTWNLKDMFESDEAWFAEYEALKEMPAPIAAFQGKLGESAETLLESFRLDDEISTRLSRLYGYASCKGDQDTGDNYYQDMRGKAMSTYVAIASAAAYRTSEIMAIPEDTLNLFYTVQPELETYRRSLYQIRRRAAHILSPKEETLLAAAGEMADSPESIGSVFPQRGAALPRSRGQGRREASAHQRLLRPPAREQRPCAPPQRFRDLLQPPRRIQEYHRRNAGCAVQVASLLRRRAQI